MFACLRNAFTTFRPTALIARPTTIIAQRKVWECPAGCPTIVDLTLDSSRRTRGFPHVECATCKCRFCASCKVEWHEGKTCHEYRLENPAIMTREELALIADMARLGARRCPRCQFMITKDGGCSHMTCGECDHQFDWYRAVKVQPPPTPIGCLTEAEAAANVDTTKANYGYDEEGDYDSEDDEEYPPIKHTCEMDRIAAGAEESDDSDNDFEE